MQYEPPCAPIQLRTPSSRLVAMIGPRSSGVAAPQLTSMGFTPARPAWVVRETNGGRPPLDAAPKLGELTMVRLGLRIFWGTADAVLDSSMSLRFLPVMFLVGMMALVTVERDMARKILVQTKRIDNDQGERVWGAERALLEELQ